MSNNIQQLVQQNIKLAAVYGREPKIGDEVMIIHKSESLLNLGLPEGKLARNMSARIIRPITAIYMSGKVKTSNGDTWTITHNLEPSSYPWVTTG